MYVTLRVHAWSSDLGDYISYKVKFETISIGSVNYKIRSLLDRQQFSDPDGEALNLGISSAVWPLFGLIWPMGKILANLMLAEQIAGKRILEIGCGIALPSIVIKQLGGDITATDYHPLARAFLARNLTLNSLSPIEFTRGDWNSANKELKKFDLIIGSDLLYEPQHVELLAAFIDRHSSSQSNAIIIDPGRGFHRKFARAMEKRGYTHRWDDLRSYPEAGIIPKGVILHFQRSM